MSNLKCKLLGIHNYKFIGIQTVTGLLVGFNTPLTRQVFKCKGCDKVHLVGLYIGSNEHLNDKLNWLPKLEY